MPPTTPGNSEMNPPRTAEPRPSGFRWLGTPVRHVWKWFRFQPRALQIGLCLVLSAAMVTGGTYVWYHLNKRAQGAEVAAGHQEYRSALANGDLEAMQAALDRILAVNPNDVAAIRIKRILDRGESDSDTPDLAALFLQRHIQADRRAEAAREAEKVLAHNPKHWVARCALAHHALEVQHDPALAEQILGQLPDPEDPNAELTPSGLLYALQLFEVLGLDSVKLRRVIVLRLLPALRSSLAASAPPGAKWLLLNCYLAPFADRDSLTELGAVWGVVDRLAEEAVAGAIAAADVPLLIQLGILGPRLRGALALLRAHDPVQLPDERFQSLTKTLDDRTRRTWQAVRQLAPDQIEAYRGLALLAVQQNDGREAVQQLLDGLAACGDRSELFELLIPLLARIGTDQSVQALARSVMRAAEAAQTDASKWCLAAAAAMAADRSDEALRACARARQIMPNHPWACATEAQLWVRAGNFVKAREALTPLGEPALRSTPLLIRLNARTLMGCGLFVLLENEFQAVAAAQAKLKPPTRSLVMALLLGVFDSEPTREQTQWVIDKVTQVLAEDPTVPGGRRLQAEALVRLAELSVTANPKMDGSPPLWKPETVAMALKAFEQLPLNERTEVGVLATMAGLQLRGQDLKAAALRTITPLIPLEASLAPAQLEILGAVLLANDRVADALRVLERAVKLPQARAGCWVTLALAYHKNNQPIDARAALARAFEVTSCSEREHLERIAAKILLQREISR